MTSFIGRQHELKILNQHWQQGHANFIVIKGRRRIGKSRLIREFSQHKTYYRFVGLAPEPHITDQDQRNHFANSLRQYFPAIPKLKADDWSELFRLLATNTRKGQVLICMDEISWLAHKDPTFLPKLKDAWDEQFSLNNKLMLIICSSISLWIEKNILSSTGFVGRVNHVMKITELSLNESSQLMRKNIKHLSTYDQFKYLCIGGGVPLYLENYKPQLPLEENLKLLCYTSGGLLIREFNQIFSDLFGKRHTTYKAIVSTLVKGPQTAAQISKTLKTTQSGIITDYLLDLTEAGFISRDFHWEIKTHEYTTNSRYRLSDNYLRFYLRYLDKHKQQIDLDHYQYKSLASLPEWSSMMGLQFENLVLNNQKLIWDHLPINPEDIVMNGAFYQTTTKRHKGCQIDYMVQTRLNNVFICEIRFQREEIKIGIIKEVEEKIKRLAKPKQISCFPVLIHINGVSDSVLDSVYFTSVINFSDLIS